jgi:hypothetical protein
VTAWSRLVPHEVELRIPPVYLWKTDLSASMVTEVGPLAMAALSCGTDLEATLVYERTSDEVVFLYLQVPVLAVYG